MEVPFQVSPLTVHDIMSYAVPQKTSLDASSVSGDDPAHQPSAAAAPTTLGEKTASVVLGQSATILQAHHHCNHALASKVRRREPLPQKRGRRGPLSRSSVYRGVTFYRRTSRWEAHVWTNGKQQYLGGYKDEEIAAKVYDKAVIKIRGKDADTNFPAEEYAEEMREMRASEVSVGEFICLLRSEAKRQNKLRREAEGRDTSDSSNPYGESLRLKSCRTWLSRTLGQGPPPLAGLATPSPALVTTATAQNPTAAASLSLSLFLSLARSILLTRSSSCADVRRKGRAQGPEQQRADGRTEPERVLRSFGVQGPLARAGVLEVAGPDVGVPPAALVRLLPRPQHLPGPRVYAREPRLLPGGRLRRRFLRQELHDDPVQHLCLRRWVWFDLHRLSVQSIRQEELRVRTLRDRRVRLHRLHVHRELQVRLQHKQLRQRLWGCSMGHIPGLWNSGERASKRPIPFQPAPI